MTIQDDIKTGQIAEQRVIDIFEKYGWQCTSCNSKEYDIKVVKNIQINNAKKENVYYVEVKYDKMSSKTGNLAIEVLNTKWQSASGITVTDADFWVHIVDEHIYICTVGDLRLYIQEHQPKRVIKTAGDGNAMIYLYPKEEILSAIFISLEKMTNYELDLYLLIRGTSSV